MHKYESRIEELKDLILSRARGTLEKDGVVDEEELAGVEKDLNDIVGDWFNLADENPKARL